MAQLAALGRLTRDVRDEATAAHTAAPLTAEEEDQLCHLLRIRRRHSLCRVGIDPALSIHRQMLAAPTCFFCKQVVELTETVTLKRSRLWLRCWRGR